MMQYFRSKKDLHFSENFGVVHRGILEITSRPDFNVRVSEHLEELRKLQKETKTDGTTSSTYKVTLREVINMLVLATGNLAAWKKELSRPADLEKSDRYNTYSTKSYLLKKLPEDTKKKLLLFLGQRYAELKDREAVQPIHLILDPQSLLTKMRSEGKSDLEFYNTYLALVKKSAFPNVEVGGYSGNLVIQIAKAARRLLQTQKFSLEYIFFGSITNGFAKSKSDIDLFNTTQLYDSGLEKQVNQILQGTPWKWHLEAGNEPAHEHFGAVSHVFTFAIYKDRIELRFYPNSQRVRPDGSERDPFEYTVLNIPELNELGFPLVIHQ